MARSLSFPHDSAGLKRSFHPGHVRGTIERPQRQTLEAVSQPSAEIVDIEYRQAFRNVRALLSVFTEMGKPVKMDDAVLDFGCGEGRMVYAFRKLGYRAFGTDIALPCDEAERLMRAEGLCRPTEQTLTLIHAEDYKIPFDNERFDFVVSWDVMEHVQHHAEALSEINRVLKPGGRSLHFFPSRYCILEPHIGVPLGTVLQGYSYLYLWALLGLRDKSQQACTAREVASKNYEFLSKDTKYLSKRRLVRLADGCFRDIEFVEKHFWKHTGGKGQFIYKILSRLGLVKLVPLAASLLSPFGYRALFFVKP
jgi:ubiquinone/menaquinone biosynthesis C-methylase UbiE